jgi:hypothetical protein
MSSHKPGMKEFRVEGSLINKQFQLFIHRKLTLVFHSPHKSKSFQCVPFPSRYERWSIFVISENEKVKWFCLGSIPSFKTNGFLSVQSSISSNDVISLRLKNRNKMQERKAYEESKVCLKNSNNPTKEYFLQLRHTVVLWMSQMH